MSRREDKFPDNGFEAWGGYMQAKIAKLEEQYTKRAGREDHESDIFCGVCIYVNGYTIPSADELKILMSKHGGVYHTYQRSDDFIIASNLPDTKVKNMSLAKVVKPEWITESIEAKRLLDYRDYLLYKVSRNQAQLNFNKVIKSDNTTISLNLENSTTTTDTSVEVKKSNNVSPDAFRSISPNNLQIGNSTDAHTKDSHDVKLGRVTKTAADPNFISEFYNNSRLHHISQLGAMFKQHVNDLRENSNFSFPTREELRNRVMSFASNNLSPITFEKGKTIMHIDMDCFFVSVGLRKRPDLRGKPVAVTHSKGGQSRLKRPGVDRDTEFSLYKQKQAKKFCLVTGLPDDEIKIETRVDGVADEGDEFGSMSEIASCSYEARAKGIKNGMFMGPALRLCPDLQTIPYDFEGYKEVAYTLYNTVAQYTLDIEAVSCDEMYVDCTELLKTMNMTAQDFATALREEIRCKTGCPCSTGFGGNRLQARLATKRAKPDGQFFLTADLVEDFMYDIKLRDLPGVGRQIAQKLESLGHQTCGSLQSLSLMTLQNHLGNKTGSQLFDQCRGRDSNPLTFHTVRKSVSAEVNYGIRFENNEQCIEFLKQLATEVQNRMQQFKVVGKCITLKLMVRAADAPVETAKFMGHGFCDVINKSTSLNTVTNDAEIITREVILIYKKQNIDPKEMRGVGIQITKLESTNIKQTKGHGAINKFLTASKISPFESKPGPSYEYRPMGQVSPSKHTSVIKSKNSTPKKTKIPSPRKKSPILAIKSPGKKRGRPKGSKNAPSTSRNLMSKFLQGNSVRDTPYRNPMIKEDVGLSTDKVKKEAKKPQQKPEGLLGLSWEKVRELLRAWLESGQTPLPCDVNMIASYMRSMVIDKNIDKVYILLNFLKRRTGEINSREWIEVYDHVVEQVQNAMIAVYGKKMMIS